MLASILLETSMGGGTPDVSPDMLSKYTYDDGAALIAMESAADLHEIFCEGFYDMEELEIRQHISVQEGASEEVLEGIGSTIKEKAKAAFTKIKTKLEELWKKVKAFLYNTKRYLESIFSNTNTFISKYEGDLKKLKLNNFTAAVYNYTIDKAQDKPGEASKEIDNITVQMADQAKTIVSRVQNVDKSTLSEEGMANQFTHIVATFKKNKCGDSTIEMDKVKEYFWSKNRNNVKYGESPTTRRIDMNEVLKGLKDAPSLTRYYNSVKSSLDGAYKKAISTVNDAGNKAENTENSTKVAAICRSAITAITNIQNIENAAIKSQTDAITEMCAAYRKVIIAALRYKGDK